MHWAETAQEVNRLVLEIARRNQVRKIIKSKSMLGEETGLNAFLQSAGIEVRETDLGEYIIQEARRDALAHHRPGDAPAPRTRSPTCFTQKHRLPRKTDIAEMTREARMILRPHFLTADMGITGANFLVAETGHDDDRHQRRQWSHDHDHAARARRDRRHRESAATLEDVCFHPAAADALCHRAVDQQLPDVHHRPQAGGRVEGPEEFHIIIVDAGRTGCSRPSCAKRCVAFAAAPA